MAQPRRERKGRPRWTRILGVVVLAAIVSAPVMLIVGALITPLLWKLEAAIGSELAGHSGPLDWVLLTLCVAFTVCVSGLYAWRTRPNDREAGPPDDADGTAAPAHVPAAHAEPPTPPADR